MRYVIKEDYVEAELGHGILNVSGDDALGYRPYQLLVSSVASCSGAVFKQILVKQRTDFEEVSITAEVERNPDEANRIETIFLTFIVKGHQLNEKKLERNLKIARKNCGMIRSIEGSINVKESLEIIEL